MMLKAALFLLFYRLFETGGLNNTFFIFDELPD